MTPGTTADGIGGTTATANGKGTGTDAEGGDRNSSIIGDKTSSNPEPTSQSAQQQHQQVSPPVTVAIIGTGQEVSGFNNNKPLSSDSGDPDEQEDDEILEESPEKRWSKRREKVKQRDVPGIDAAFLAMDNETGNEVVWNEVLFSERKNFREQEEKIRSVFDHLTRLEHPNLVKFHKYWMDTKSEKPRIIFITEYMSSGSMSRFLQRARSSGSLLNIKAWKNWTRQILSALSYLHSCDPPIVHANLTCNTVFIQQNGMVKIGCVAPNTIHHHVKTFRENIKNIHYLAPEYDHLTEATTQADIFSFGVCALEMATTGALQSGTLNGAVNACEKSAASTSPPAEKTGAVATTTAGGSGFHMVTDESMRKALGSLEDCEQKEFIERCLEHDPSKRANVVELLNLLGPPEPEKNETSLDEDGFIEERHESHETTPTAAVERITTSPQHSAPSIETAAPSIQQQQTIIVHNPQTSIVTSVAHPQPTADGYQQNVQCSTATTISIAAHATATVVTTTSATVPTSTSTNKLLQAPPQHTHAAPDEGYNTTESLVDMPTGGVVGTPLAELLSAAANGSTTQYRETRQVLQMHAEVLEDGQKLRIQLQFDDQMNRQLIGVLRAEDTPEALVAEMVQHGFLSEMNSGKMRDLLEKVLKEHGRRQLD